MKRVKVDCSGIHDWESFHDVFADGFGFLAGYGRNMNAWVDCMSYLDDPESGMSGGTCEKGDFIVIELGEVADFKKRCPEQYEALIECSAFVNYRNLEVGENPLLMLSFHA